MRLATFRTAGGVTFGAVSADRVVDIMAAVRQAEDTELGALTSVLQLIQAGPAAIERAAAVAESALDRGTEAVHSLSSVELLAPVPRPPKVICVGRNYGDHLGEVGGDPPPFPSAFAKLPSNIIGPGAPILLPAMTSQVDYEAELAVVIGRPMRHVSAREALAHVVGYTILNDVSARDIQLEHKQLTIAKNFRSFAPLGPWITTVDAAGDVTALGIRLWLNGELRQDGNTRDQIFSTAEIIAFLSTVTDLEPGDVISTGTPAGVGMGMDPPQYLQPGDTIRIEIDGLGTLENPVAIDPRTPIGA